MSNFLYKRKLSHDSIPQNGVNYPRCLFYKSIRYKGEEPITSIHDTKLHFLQNKRSSSLTFSPAYIIMNIELELL